MKLKSSFYVLLCSSNLSNIGSGSKKTLIPLSPTIKASISVLMTLFMRNPFVSITFLCLEKNSFPLEESASSLQKHRSYIGSLRWKFLSMV